MCVCVVVGSLISHIPIYIIKIYYYTVLLLLIVDKE